jgi:hypothetical protein
MNRRRRRRRRREEARQAVDGVARRWPFGNGCDVFFLDFSFRFVFVFVLEAERFLGYGLGPRYHFSANGVGHRSDCFFWFSHVKNTRESDTKYV